MPHKLFECDTQGDSEEQLKDNLKCDVNKVYKYLILIILINK